MAQSSWMQSLGNFLTKKAVSRSPEPYLDFSRQCLEEVRTMILPRDSKSSKFINYEQCIYLADSLDKAVHKASLFFEHNRQHSGNSVSTEDVRKSTLEQFKILCMLANKVKYFIQGCCSGHWLQAAVMLTNLSDCTVSLGFDLNLFTALLGPYSDSRRDALYSLTISDLKCVKEMASKDEDSLATKLIALIQSGIRLGQASNDDLKLATFQLERLYYFKQSSRAGSSQSILLERDLTNLKYMVQIARGGFGTVHKASWLGIDVAVKTFHGTDNPSFKKEVRILAGLSHFNIVSFHCYGKNTEECFIVMELMEQNLFSLLKQRLQSDRTRSSPFSEFEEFDVMLQIAEAMDYLHKMRVLHGDLKSHNILVRCPKSPNAEGYEYVQVKVSDFGLSRTKGYFMTQSDKTLSMGTTRWMAPELMRYWNSNDIRDIETMEKYPFKCDVYSFGMVCLEILTGDVPFPNVAANKVKTAVCAGDRPQIPDRCHGKLKALIEKCWNPDATCRPCFGDICTELRHLKSLHMTGSPALSPIAAPARPIEREWKAYWDAVKLQLVNRASRKKSPYKRSPPPPTVFSHHENFTALDRSSTASPGTLMGRVSLTRSDELLRRNSEPMNTLDLPTSPEALPSPRDRDGKSRQLELSDQGSEPARRGSFFIDGVGLPTTALAVCSGSLTSSMARDSHRTNSVGSIRWKPRDTQEVESSSNHAKEVSVGVDFAGGENPEKAFVVEKVEESLTPSSGDSSVESFRFIFPKKPSWSSWAKGEFLGSGTFGKVYEGVGSNGIFFAVKEVSHSDQGQNGKQAIRQLEQEIALLSEIQHPNIVQYLGTERDDENLYIFLELVSKGSLAQLYKKYVLFYDQVRAYSRQILAGLKYLHDLKIIHRDIKCANILVDASGVVKLADFGMAKQVDKLVLLKSFLGSAHWMAPEVVDPRRSYNLMADIWSLGCTVLEMAIGKLPYGQLEPHSVLWKVGHGEGPPIPDELEEDLKSFISNCLEVDVANRPTCDLLMTHPFITGAPMKGPVKLVPTPELMH